MGRKIFTFGILMILAVAFVLSATITSTASAAGEKVKVLIGFKQMPGAAEQALVRGFGGEIKYAYHIVPAIAATVPEAAIEGLRRNPNVTRVELDIKVYAIDDELDNTWGVKRIDAGAVHDSGNKGTNVKVGILDSGIDYTHSDLDANYVSGYDFVNGDVDPMDDNGHGTHVAGTVAAEDNGFGVVGVAPEAKLYALKVLGSDGSGNYSYVIAALQWAVDNGIQVTNNSYGSSGDPGETVKAAFDNAYAAGILSVCAAGNNGNPPGRGDNVIYPARYASCIAVAATDQSDKRAKWSSTGPDLELSAPGVSINSTLLGGGYGTKSGTSMASPHVSGTAALAIVAGVTDVRGTLVTTADDLGDSGWDPKYGHGLVDADEAAGQVNDPPTVSITSPTDGSTFDSGATILFEGTASDTEDGDLTASLVWTSSIDCQIGTGGSFSTALSDGNHTITASVTDGGGKTGSASISITVGTPSEPTMYVKSIVFSSKVAGPNKFLYTTVKVVNGDGIAVVGVRLELTLKHESGSSWNFAGDTGTNGTVKFTLLKAQTGTYTATVTNLLLTDYTWDTTKGVTSASCTLNDDGSITDQGAAKIVASTPPGNSLGQSYPNPANPSTEISYSIGQSGLVTLKIYNLTGQLVRTLVDEAKTAGTYVVRWNGKDDSGALAASGVYFYRMVAGNYSQTRRMVMLR